MEYTKGEWKVTYDGDTYYIVTPDKPNRPYKAIAKLSGNNNDSEANAHLIAQAPRLYEALKEAEQHLIMLGTKSDSYARRSIKQALAKVERGS